MRQTTRIFVATVILTAGQLIPSLVIDRATAATASGEGPTEAFAKVQAQRQVPKQISDPEIQCKERDIGFSTRWRCVAHWNDE